MTEASASTPPAPAPGLSNEQLVLRLLRLTWNYRWGCVKVLLLQLLLILLGLAGLALAGLGIDFIRHQVDPAARAPHWPLGRPPPAGWSPMETVTAICLAIVATALLRTVINYAYSVSLADLLQRRMVVDLRARIYRKLQRLSFRFFDDNASGSIINRVTGDVQSTRLFIDGVLIQAIVMTLSLLLYLVYMLHIHPLLTLVCLSPTPLLLFLSSRFARRMRPAYEQNRTLVDKMILVLSESVQGITVIKGFARESESVSRFARSNRSVFDQKQQITGEVSRFTPAIGFASQVSLVILLIYGGILAIHGQLPLGTGLVVFAGLLQQFSGQVTTIATIANSAQESLTSARRVFEVLDAPLDIDSPPSPVRLPRVRGEVEFRQVRFGYTPAAPVLKEISFHVDPGQCVAIVGTTGSGKSTLLSLIPRFYDPTQGAILVDGHDIRTLALDDLRRKVGIVFQENFLFSHTVASNIAFGNPSATPEQIERAARLAAAHDFIMALPEGYHTVLGEGGCDLSGGQRQRLAIARALLLEPALLILDDPTAAIDPQTEHEIMESMDGAMKGRTTFIVAHRLSTLRRADLVLVLEHGRLIQQGRHSDLMAVKGPYQRLALAQVADEETPPAPAPATAGREA